MALASPPARRCYGPPSLIANVWLSLVTALETAENINDFAEYKYKDTLTDHVSRFMQFLRMIKVETF